MKLYRMGLAATAMLLFTVSLSAQIAHTWVSATGSDANAGTAKKSLCRLRYRRSQHRRWRHGLRPRPRRLRFRHHLSIHHHRRHRRRKHRLCRRRRGHCWYRRRGCRNIVLRNLTIDGGGTGSGRIGRSSSPVREPRPTLSMLSLTAAAWKAVDLRRSALACSDPRCT